MTGFGIFLIIYWSLNALASILMIGESRPSITKGGAIFALIIYGLLIFATIHYLHI